MKYQIKGGNMPVVECSLASGEAMNCQAGAMVWMSDTMEMGTHGGGLGKMFGRMFSGESAFQNTYTARGDGMIAFGSSFPGSIYAVELGAGADVVCQKRAYLASTPGVELSVFFQKKAGAGFFGGEGFIMQRLSGKGMAFLEIDGAAVEHTLAPGEKLVIDTGYLAMMDATCSIDVVGVKGLKNVAFGGEGLFNTVVTGPGRVVLQTMPANKLAEVIIPFIPKTNS